MSWIEREIEKLLGKAPHLLGPEDREAIIKKIRGERSAQGLPTLEDAPPLKPRKARKTGLKKPHGHKCERCGALQPCPIGPGCLEGPEPFGICSGCGGSGLALEKMRSAALTLGSAPTEKSLTTPSVAV